MERTITILKAIADANRLRILALLAQLPRSGDELAALLDLQPSTVSHHLARLQKAGLVVVTVEQYYHVYRLETETLAQLRTTLTPDALVAMIAGQPQINQEAYRMQILDKWIDANRLQALPTPIKQREVVLQWLADKFTPDQRYAPRQVDDLLDHWCNWHDSRRLDSTTVTRALVEHEFLARTRDGRWYWRADSPKMQEAQQFTPEMLSPADTTALQVEIVPSRLRRLVKLAMRVKANQPLTHTELDEMLIDQGVAPTETAEVRVALIAESLLEEHTSSCFVRPTIGPDHPANQKLRMEALARSSASD